MSPGSSRPSGPASSNSAMAPSGLRFSWVLRWAPVLTGEDMPLPHSEHRWSGRKTCHADLEEMCRIGPEIDAEEFERRRRAFAEQPGSRMTLTLHGREFLYTAPTPLRPVIELAKG